MSEIKTPQEKVLDLVSWETANSFSTVDLIRERYSCRCAVVEHDGRIWAGDPQTARWLSDSETLDFLAWVEKQKR
jgi:hypothetical protein